MVCIFSYSHRMFEINQHKYTTNSALICTFNIFRSNHFICIFQNFLDPGKGSLPPPPRPSPRSGAIRSLASVLAHIKLFSYAPDPATSDMGTEIYNNTARPTSDLKNRNEQ